jgi:PmbA protein
LEDRHDKEASTMEFENIKEELQSNIDSGLKYARSLDPDAQFEIYLNCRNKSSFRIAQGIVEADDGLIAGNAVRVAKKNVDQNYRISFTSSSGTDLERIKKNIKEAISTNKGLTVIDERFKSFCYPKKGGKEGILSSKLLNLSSSELVTLSQSMTDEVRSFDERIKTVDASLSVYWGGFAIGNTNDVLNASRATVFECEISCQAIDGDDRKDGFKFLLQRDLPELEGLGTETARRALQLLGGKKLNETTSIPTIWDNFATACYIRASLGQSTGGQHVVEGLSPLTDKIGDQIACNSFTLIDDGQMPEAITTNSCDDEGYPQNTRSLVEKGVLKSFLFNTYYGTIFGDESTGNCSRRGLGLYPISLPHEQSPTVDITTLKVESGSKNKTEDDLIAEIDGRALFIRDLPMGIFHNQVSTGEFSAVASSVFLVEKGEIVTPLKSASVAGNFYTGLENIREIAGNVQMIPLLGVETPSLIIDGLSVVV